MKPEELEFWACSLNPEHYFDLDDPRAFIHAKWRVELTEHRSRHISRMFCPDCQPRRRGELNRQRYPQGPPPRHNHAYHQVMDAACRTYRVCQTCGHIPDDLALR